MRAAPAQDPKVHEGGYVLILTALLLVPLLVATGFATDLGAWYGRASQLQKSADAASLAGVVWMPNIDSAKTAARAVLARNGFPDTNNNNVADDDPNVTFEFTQGASDRQFVVTIHDAAADMFFSSLVLNGVSISRRATAEIVVPVPLGSPANVFGNNMPGAPGCVQPTSCPPQPNLWAAIQGPYTRHQDGDAIATKCAGDTESHAACDSATNPNGAANAEYRKSGYIFAVNVPQSAVDSASPVTVQIYDASTIDRASGTETGDSGDAIHTRFELFKSDGSDLTMSTDPSLSMNGQCSAGPGRQLTFREASYRNTWYTLCTFTPTVAGVYPLQVKTSDISGVPDEGSGWNAYSLRATGAAGVTLFGVNDMSIWTNMPSSVARFYLAEIKQFHAGKKLQIDLYDPGDGSGASAFNMQFLAPPSGLPTVPPNGSGTAYPCSYGASATRGTATLSSNSATCTIVTKNAGSSTGVFNNRWLRIEIQIPPSYTCSTDCWWTVKYDFGSSTPTDRTVWAVAVYGDPVHLVE